MNKSEELYERALQILPGGCSRNTVLRKPHPLYHSHANGAFITDVEGVKRCDFANNMAALIHGHAHPAITEAVTQQLSKGSASTFASEIEIIFAEHLIARSPSFEKLRFVNSGTEAVMAGIKAARAYSGKAKIAKVEGAYHGLYDYAEASQTAKPDNWGTSENPQSVAVAHGTPQSALDDVIIIPFNDIETSLKILNVHKDDLATLLIDLMPHRVALHPANKDYVEALFNWTRENNILFFCDEVITYRSEYGGAQSWYDIDPDLTAMGKMIGGGFPVGAIAGKASIMDVMNPLNKPILFPHSGTFSANPITMVAGYTAMSLFDRDTVTALNKLTQYCRDKITEAINIADVDACVAGAGSMFRLHMRRDIPNDYRSAYQAENKEISFLLDHLFDNGFSMINTCSGALSTVMEKRDIDNFADILLDGLRALKARRTLY